MNEPNPSIANRRATTVSMLVAVVMIAQQVAGKAARDAFFLSHFPASALPAVMVAATVLSFGVIFVISRILRTVPPAKAAPWIFTCNGALFVAEFALSGPQPHVTAVMIYLHIAALGAAAVSIFWSVVSECFDPHRAKRAIARIAVGASFGGVIGGVSGWQLGKVVSLPVLFLILALANVVCALGIASLSGPRARPTSVGKAPSAMDVMRETPYLRLLAVLVALGAMTDTVVDFVFKASAQAEYSSSGDLMSFFAIFYAVTGILTFLSQTTLVERSLRTNGLIGTVASRPGFMIGGALFVLAFPRFLFTVILRGGAQVVENSFYRSGYEILYTPLTPDKKRPTKTLIDVGLERIGVAVGAGCVLLVVALAPSHADSALFGVAALAAITSLFVCSRLHRGYVDALVD
ncbi:MAG: hypothetical protein JKY56_03995, partial [Kofleriaceae bacterium]|nr:hypothetical protein [Kofleriaceae bacterium]